MGESGTGDDARWLSDEEGAAWRSLMSSAMWLPPALDQQLQADAGMSHFEYGVLAALSERDDRTMRLRELARWANSTLSRLSKVVDRLTGQGWVERRPDPDDGRSTLATLTDAGFAKVVATAPGHVAHVRALVFDHLTRAEVKQLGAIAAKIARSVGPDGACSGKLG